MPELDRAKDADLKPCPFCGGRAYKNENNGKVNICCERCCCRTMCYYDHHKAIAAWSARQNQLASDVLELVLNNPGLYFNVERRGKDAWEACAKNGVGEDLYIVVKPTPEAALSALVAKIKENRDE